MADNIYIHTLTHPLYTGSLREHPNTPHVHRFPQGTPTSRLYNIYIYIYTHTNTPHVHRFPQGTPTSRLYNIYIHTLTHLMYTGSLREHPPPDYIIYIYTH
jgi:hypothetical protein